MPSVGSFNPLSVISRLRLYLNCDGTLAYTSSDELGWLVTHRETNRRKDETPIMEYEWNDAEKEDLAGVCSAITANFPALRDVEVLNPKICDVFCKIELANSTIFVERRSRDSQSHRGGQLVACS
jgi:hypothetical protein